MLGVAVLRQPKREQRLSGRAQQGRHLRPARQMGAMGAPGTDDPVGPVKRRVVNL